MLHVEDSVVATAEWAGPARPGLIGEVRAGLLAFAREHGMRAGTCRDLGVAVSEAVTNAVRHAYPDGEAGEVAVTATVDGGRLTVRVADHGTGAVSESLGFGTQIMRATSDRLVVGASPAGPGTVVTMEFLIAGQDEPPDRVEDAMTVEETTRADRPGVLHVSGRVAPLDVAILRRDLRTRLLRGRRVVLDLTETQDVAVGHLVLMLLGLRAEARRRDAEIVVAAPPHTFTRLSGNAALAGIIAVSPTVAEAIA